MPILESERVSRVFYKWLLGKTPLSNQRTKVKIGKCFFRSKKGCQWEADNSAEFEIEITDAEAKKFTTIGEICDYIDKTIEK